MTYKRIELVDEKYLDLYFDEDTNLLWIENEEVGVAIPQKNLEEVKNYLHNLKK